MNPSDPETKGRMLLEALASELAARAAAEAQSEALEKDKETEAYLASIDYVAFEARIREKVRPKGPGPGEEALRTLAAGVQEGIAAGKRWLRVTLDEGIKNVTLAYPLTAGPRLSGVGVRRDRESEQPKVPPLLIESPLIPTGYTALTDAAEARVLVLNYRQPQTGPKAKPEVSLWLGQEELEHTEIPMLKKGKFAIEYVRESEILRIYFIPDQEPRSVAISANDGGCTIFLDTP